MNLASIQPADTARPTASAMAPARPAPGNDEQAIAEGLSSLDNALDKGDLAKARKALSSIRSSAGLTSKDTTSEADPLSEVSSALGSDDLSGARKAWSDFRSALEDDAPVDYNVTVTRTATFSILA